MEKVVGASAEVSGWRSHPKLRGRFLPGRPDDLKVLAHDGGPGFTRALPEPVCVTVTSCDGDVFTGRVLDRPQQLETIRQGQDVRFVMALRRDKEYPLLVSDKYVRDQSLWTIHPCDKCGSTELLDAPSDLMRVAFPTLAADAVMERFTAPCTVCDAVRSFTLKPQEQTEAFQKYPLKADVIADWNQPAYWHEYYRRLLNESDTRRRDTVINRDVSILIRMLRQAGELPRASPQTLLDAGCGIALIPHVLAFWGFRVTAIDSCPRPVKVMSQVEPTQENLADCLRWAGPAESFPGKFVPAEPVARALQHLQSLSAPGGSVLHVATDWFAADLSPGSFGVVHCRNSLRHSPKPYWRRSLLRFHELLTPGGVFLLENTNALWMRDEVKELVIECGFVPLAAGAVRGPDAKYIIDAWPTG